MEPIVTEKEEEDANVYISQFTRTSDLNPNTPGEEEADEEEENGNENNKEKEKTKKEENKVKKLLKWLRNRSKSEIE